MHFPKVRPYLRKPRRRALLQLLLLIISLFVLVQRHRTSSQNHTLPKLPIHQICLTSCPTIPQTTNVAASVVRTPATVLQYIRTLPNNTIIYLTASCIKQSPNTRELLYLALHHHKPSVVVPYTTGHTLDAVLPLITTASTLRGTSFQQVLKSLVPILWELPSTTTISSCNYFSTAINRRQISIRSANALPKTLFTERQHITYPLRPVPFTPPRKQPFVVLLVMPWLQMGGSEQSMLKLAEYAISLGYTPAFMLLQPFWGELQGRLVTSNDWIHRAYALTSLVYDTVNLAPYHRRAELMRYVFEIHRPRYVITANSRLFYNLLPMVRLLLPANSIIADYTHMVHQTWLGGGMPRYAANRTTFIDRHFTASDNVTNAIRGWVHQQGVDTRKVQTCYIGADVKPFHRGIRKHFIRRMTRARMRIANHKILVLFAGRFVLDKGVDVLVEVIKRLDDPRYAFLAVGSGGMEALIQPLKASGRVVIRPGASDTEMAEYYAASDILLLPSVKEGIALVLYEAMANGVLVITTDVGGQKELVTPDRGVLLQRGPTLQVASDVLKVLADIPKRTRHYSRLRENGEQVVRERFTSERFVECVFSGLKGGRRAATVKGDIESVTELVTETLKLERRHNEWALRVFPRSVSGALTVVQMASKGRESNISGLRQRYKNISVVNRNNVSGVADVDTEAALVLPEGYDMEHTDLQAVVNVLRRPVGRIVFDIIGMRIRGTNVGRLMISKNGMQMCRISEELFEETSENGLKSLDAANVVQIHEVYAADVLGAVFVVRTETLKNGLKKGKLSSVSDNEELFRVAKMEGWHVGYVHDVVVETRGDDSFSVVDGRQNVAMCDVSRQELLY